MIELKRQFYDFLVGWKAEKGRECLLVKGARQIGKTFIIEKFGRENYDSFIEINFIEEPDFCAVFNGSLDADTICAGISAIRPDVRFVPDGTLIFLDEIQECPNARTALKFLAQDGRYDVVASGSLLGIKYKRKDREPKSIPVGFERQITMHSLSFEEFLWAKGYDRGQIWRLREYFLRRDPVPEVANGKFHDLMREYAVVGGMPEVVSGYIENRHFGDVQRVQEKILSSYIDDIHKYASTVDIPKIERCFRAMPLILAKENRKFKYSEVEKGASARKYLSSVDWLKDSSLASLAECVNVALTGLSGYIKEDWFKLYLSDVGLLCASYGMLTKRQVLDGSLKGSVKGGIYENLVAGILARNGIPLIYYRKDEVEMEFVVETGDGVVPVEVKAQSGRTLSLDKMLQEGHIPYGYKLTGGNIGVSGKKITMPHYMAMFITSAT
ncbi:MAG: ATP-binding protein [Kiritimatiellae bacterium]|nr:ATP-binding protein [Kiritimatiellia bacterium]